MLRNEAGRDGVARVLRSHCAYRRMREDDGEAVGYE